MRIDLFCKVVDNFGDAGVCWRLARQLAADAGAAVRLWIDDLARLAPMSPSIDPRRVRQTAEGIEVCRWLPEFPPTDPHPVVIEAFGCGLPEPFIAAMASRARPPLWINLEYLSAEPWVDSFHGLPSPQPRLPLVRHFFFPGFTPRTGGLFREADLPDRRRALGRSAAGDFLASLGLPPAETVADRLRVSMFCYPNAALPALVDAWAEGDESICCLLPAAAPDAVRAAFGLEATTGRSVRGSLRTFLIPFLAQDDYDRLLWSCAINFVRGEDSFLRAQWAARPFVWQAYPQADDAHHAKVSAFLARYLDPATGIDDAEGRRVRHLFEAWNGMRPAADLGRAWREHSAARARLSAHAVAWESALTATSPLSARLASFIDSKLK